MRKNSFVHAIRRFVPVRLRARLRQARDRTYMLPGDNQVRRITRALSPAEFAVFVLLAILFVGSTLGLLGAVNARISVPVPASGGTLVEGIVGVPRFVNPLLAASNADRDLTALVYAGLMKPAPSGGFTTDLASGYTISDDGLTYTFEIQKGARFHDGTPVTAEDVVFTVRMAKNPSLQSPKRANWEGIAVEAVNAHTVTFTLEQAYAPFLANTTLPILPKHIWDDVSTDQFTFSTHNIEAIGAGPYEITDIDRTDAGVPTKYTLTAFDAYAGGTPHLSELVLRFYENQRELTDALTRGRIDSAAGLSPDTLAAVRDDQRVKTVPLPRVFAIFFNQDEAPVFTDRTVRHALNVALDRAEIVDRALSGYGTPIDGPIPPGPFAELPTHVAETATTTTARLTQARTILTEGGWVFNESQQQWQNEETSQPLQFSIATANTPELKTAAQAVAEQWRALDVDVTVDVFEPSDLNQNVIRARRYDALFFGEIIGRELDLYAFWHSSQRNDPGLNVALYANIEADNVLEEARTTQDRAKRVQLHREFEQIVRTDLPAAFVYAPDFIYVLPENIQGVSFETVTVPSERFANVSTWYRYTDHVWRIFSDTAAVSK